LFNIPEVISNLNSIHNAPINESTRYECHTPKASRAQINTVCGKYFITNNLLIKNEHSNKEKLDLHHLQKLADAVIKVDWEALPTERSITESLQVYKGAAFTEDDLAYYAHYEGGLVAPMKVASIRMTLIRMTKI